MSTPHSLRKPYGGYSHGVRPNLPQFLHQLVLMNDTILWGSFSAAISGFGMALLYPNLSAAVADIAHPNWRGAAIGIYRFWRDLGYGIGALALGVAANLTSTLEAGFWFVSVAMLLSGAILWWRGEETHPRLNPAAVDC